MTAVYDDLDHKYATICSEATLQSDVKGFFKPFVDHVTEVAERSGLLEQLRESAGDTNKLHAVLHNTEVMEIIEQTLSCIQPMYREKSAVISKEKRQEAQLALRNSDPNKALVLCSQAVIRAPAPGENELVDGGLSLALALWVRSEALMEIGQYELALRDLRLALKERLPARQRGEYYWRMGNCYKGAGEPTKAKVSYDLAARLLSTSPELRARLEADVERRVEVNTADTTRQLKEISLKSGARENMPSLSKLIKISEESDKGRFAVAAEPIRTGDVLLVEQPYAACLLPEYFGSHCCHCFKRLLAPVPCPRCSGVAFCSPECRDSALSTYHAYECSFSDLFMGSGMSILSHIALRMVTQIGLETALSIHSKHIANNCKTVEGTALNDIEGINKMSKLKSMRQKLARGKKNTTQDKEAERGEVEDYGKKEDLELRASQVYSLCSHAELRNPRDFLQRILMSLFLVSCLRQSKFFEGYDSEEKNKAVTSTTELILRNLQLLQFNAHELYETMRTPAHKFNGVKACYMAVALYPTAALFNHECYPAVGRYFDGTKIVLRAIRPLRPGEVVAENYGPQFLVRLKADRQRALACRYWFKCRCRACEQDWPLLKKTLNGAEPHVMCGNNKCERGVQCIRNGEKRSWPRRCPACGHNIIPNELTNRWNNIMRCIEGYQKAERMMKSEKVEEALNSLCSSLDLFHESGAAPHRETHLAQEALRLCFADSGNVHIVQHNAVVSDLPVNRRSEP